MHALPGSNTASGVFVADDFRTNLIIDRFDPVFVGMRASKLKHMRSENSEDVASWNVFRTFRQIDPSLWIAPMMRAAFGQAPDSDTRSTTVDLWRGVPPPPALLEGGDEGVSEIDILIENPQWVLFIEAKLTSDISTGTTTRPNGDQVLRNLDVGSYYAGVRDFYFALLVRDRDRTREGTKRLDKYQSRDSLLPKLPHRRDQLANLRGIGMLTWVDLYNILTAVSKATTSPPEADCASRCLGWLDSRRLGSRPSAT